MTTDRRQVLAAGGAALSLAAGPARSQESKLFPVVETAEGKVRGLRSGRINVFKGLRYGADTSGANRFMPPQPVKPWAGIRDALDYGNIAPQIPGDRRHAYADLIFNDVQPGGMGEDGLAVDAEGCLWVSLWGGWSVRRYAPDGRLLRVVRCPCANITKLAFGGPDLRTAYVTSAAIGLGPGGRRNQPAAGALFHFQAPTPGLPVHRFTTRIDLHRGE